MITATSPQGHTILQLMLARGLFIGDELRIATLRSGWVESGYPRETFGNAISLLKDQGLIKVATSKAGPVAQITQKGYATGTQPHVERRQIEQPSDKPPPARRRRVEHLPRPKLTQSLSLPAKTPKPAVTSEATEATEAAPITMLDEPVASTPVEKKQAGSAQRNVTHASVFAGSSKSRAPSSSALQLAVLGLLRNHKVRANGRMEYAVVLQEWIHMGLRHDDLLLTIKRLSDQNQVTLINHPTERLMLTKSGFDRYEGAAKDLTDGMDRWQAKKLLRATKRLGSMPAA